jgi:hypothetical protein
VMMTDAAATRPPIDGVRSWTSRLARVTIILYLTLPFHAHCSLNCFLDRLQFERQSNLRLFGSISLSLSLRHLAPVYHVVTSGPSSLQFRHCQTVLSRLKSNLSPIKRFPTCGQQVHCRQDVEDMEYEAGAAEE